MSADFAEQIATSFERELECLRLILAQAQKRGITLSSLKRFDQSARAVIRELEAKAGSECCVPRQRD